MSVRAFCGFETGDSTQLHQRSDITELSGAAAIQGSNVITGDYSLRVNPSASTGRAVLGIPGSDGRYTDRIYTGSSYTRYLRFRFKVASLPIAQSTIAFVAENEALTIVNCRIDVDASGSVYLVGASTSSAAAVVAAGSTVYTAYLKVTRNGTNELRIDTGTTVTVSPVANTSPAYSVLGTRTTATYDIVYDDWILDDSDYPTGIKVLRLDADGAGTYGGWTGAFSTVDDIPHNADTDYATTTTQGAQRSYSVESASAAAVVALQSHIVVRRVTALSEAQDAWVQTFVRTSSNDQSTTSTGDDLTTTYEPLGKVVAANLTEVASAEVGFTNRSTEGIEVRVTSACLMVLTSPAFDVTANVTTTAAISRTVTKNVTSEAAISLTGTSNIASTASVETTVSSNVATTAAITAVSGAIVSTSAAILCPTVTTDAAITCTVTKDVTSVACIAAAINVSTTASIAVHTKIQRFGGSARVLKPETGGGVVVPKVTWGGGVESR